MTFEEKHRELQLKVARALGINEDYPPLMLVTPDGAVRRVLTCFGDPIEGWSETLAAKGIAIAPDPDVRGGVTII